MIIDASADSTAVRSWGRLIPPVACLLGFSVTVAASSHLVEFAVPTANAAPFDIVTGPDGNLWFTESQAHKIGRITPAGDITEWLVPTANAAPYAIASGPDGNLWFTELLTTGSDHKIGRITPAGIITEFALSAAKAPRGITPGPDGNMWFALTATITPNVGTDTWIGRIGPDGTITEFPLAVPFNRSSLDGITTGPDGNLWFIAHYFNPPPSPCRGCGGFISGLVGRMTPDGSSVTPFSLGDIMPRDIASGPDGNLWLTLDALFLYRITPSGSITQIDLPTFADSSPDPNQITAGPDGNLWITGDGRSHQIFRVHPGGETTGYPLPDFGDVTNSFSSHPAGITPGPDGNIWFAQLGSNRIGRIAINPGDGVANLIWRATDAGGLGVWSLDGSSVHSEALLSSVVPLEWDIAAIGDLDGNGTPDLLWRHSPTGHVAAWLMTGTSVTSAPVVNGVVDGRRDGARSTGDRLRRPIGMADFRFGRSE